jgi:hypothetical protein
MVMVMLGLGPGVLVQVQVLLVMAIVRVTMLQSLWLKRTGITAPLPRCCAVVALHTIRFVLTGCIWIEHLLP